MRNLQNCNFASVFIKIAITLEFVAPSDFFVWVLERFDQLAPTIRRGCDRPHHIHRPHPHPLLPSAPHSPDPCNPNQPSLHPLHLSTRQYPQPNSLDANGVSDNALASRYSEKAETR